VLIREVYENRPVREAVLGCRWNDPICATPWPQTIFFNYYLEDSSVEGGCLKVRKTPSLPRSWANFSLSSRVPTGTHGPTCIVWANLTPCSLKVIPGTHLKRIALHDELVTAHEGRG
jgi:hypothetical protein